jgi:glycosyltransferase involved in cell wall biosynthesis
VVASSIPAVAEIAPPSVKLYPPEDEASMAAALAEVLADGATSRERALADRGWVIARYGYAAYADKMMDLLEKVTR